MSFENFTVTFSDFLNQILIIIAELIKLSKTIDGVAY